MSTQSFAAHIDRASANTVQSSAAVGMLVDQPEQVGIVINSDFEDGLSSWQVTTTGGEPNRVSADGPPLSGAAALHLQGQALVEQVLVVQPSTTYTLDVPLQGLAPAGNPIWAWAILDDGQIFREGVSASRGAWKIVHHRFQTSARARTLTIRIQNPTHAGDGLADRVVLTDQGSLSTSLANSDFEQGLEGWISATTGGEPNRVSADGPPLSGAAALHLQGQALVEQVLNVLPNTLYTLEVPLQGLAPAGNPIWAWAILDDGRIFREGAEASDGEWRVVRHTFQTSARTRTLTIRIQNPTRAGDGLADAITLTGQPATALPAPTLTATAQADPGSTTTPSTTATAPTSVPTGTAGPTATATSVAPTAVAPTITATRTTVPTASPTRTSLPTPTPGDGGIGSTAQQWDFWEQRLTASQPYANPASDVTLRVTYQGPGGLSFQSQGFWDGEATFALRAQFPSAGIWTWQSSASSGDPGLTQRGTIQVGASSGNLLATRGALRVSLNGRSLTYADQTPFFWMGDTVWDAPLKATEAEWLTYLADRSAKGFSVVQIALAPSWSADRDPSGSEPYAGRDLSRPNPAYWQRFDRMVRAANDQGLVVLVVGLMDPLAEGAPSATVAQRAAQYVAARLAGSHVVFSPTFDHPYQGVGDSTALAIRAVAPNHLVIQHPGTPSGQPTNIWAEQYVVHPAVQLAGLQTGHNGGDRSRVFGQAVSWARSLARRLPAKPVINLEAYYDSGGQVPETISAAYRGTAWDVRAAGYLSLLSGASGYTYGAYGLWSWDGEPFQRVPWRAALAFESSDQMTTLREVFERIPWWSLEPAHNRVQGAAADPTLRAVLAITSDGAAGIAYLPSGGTVRIEMGGFARPMQASWVNPETGALTGAGTVANSGVATLTPPAGGLDWVLVLE